MEEKGRELEGSIQDSPTLNSEEIARIGARCLVEELIPDGATKAEHRQICEGYTETLWYYLHQELFDMQKMMRLRREANRRLRLTNVTDWRRCTFESKFIVAVATMYDEVRARQPWEGIPEQFMGLPLCFLSWSRAREFCQIMIPFSECLGITDLNDEILHRAYAEFAVANLYMWSIHRAESFPQALDHTLERCQQIYGTPAEVFSKLYGQPREYEKLEKLLAEYGIGGFEYMSDLAKIDQTLCENCGRRTFGDILMRLVS